MIQYIQRKNLNVKKYDACIAQSLQRNIYGFSWYLDIVADNWDALVLEDYIAVMPIPWKKKYYIKYVSQPFFTQQLGFFSIKKEKASVIKQFIKKIPKKIVNINYQLNSKNKCRLAKEKQNYILHLNKPYKEVFSNFSKGRKHAINKAKKLNLKIQTIKPHELIKIAKEFYSFTFYSNKDYSKLIKLSQKGKVYGVYNQEDILLGGAIFMKDNYKITYLFSVFTEIGKKKQASSFLLNYIIKENIEKKLVLDFEGSMIKGIASFYKSFGSEKETYYQIKLNAIQRIFL